MFTSIKDVDMKILLNLDNRYLNHMCNNNHYVNNICKEDKILNKSKYRP